MIPLLCSVRGCREPLARRGSALVCSRSHSFDVARSGYVNLLQPQDRRSKNPGDAREVVAARRRLAEGGNEDWLAAEALAELDAIAPQEGRTRKTMLDVGCGEGFLLGALARERSIEAHGVDISVPAIELAARKYRGPTWVVANADRFLPWPDLSFDLVTSFTARRNGPELSRVLAGSGRLVLVVPGEDDLIELRRALLGRGSRRDRASGAIEELRGHLDLVSRRAIRRSVGLDREGVRDLLTTAYRGARARERERIETIGPLEVTLSRELLLFERSPER